MYRNMPIDGDKNLYFKYYPYHEETILKKLIVLMTLYNIFYIFERERNHKGKNTLKYGENVKMLRLFK